MRGASCGLTALLLLAALGLATAAVERGSVALGHGGFDFAGKFCFRARSEGAAGAMAVELTVPRSAYTANSSDILLLLFNDQAIGNSDGGSWQAVLDHWDDWSCETKVANSKGGRGIKPAEAREQADSVTLVYHPPEITQKTRPRWWFTAFAQCDGGVHDADFKLHAVQLHESDWSKEFGANESGLNTLYVAFFVYLTLLLAVHAVSTYRLQRELTYVHPMLKLFLLVLTMEYIATFLLMLHYGSYAQNGSGLPLLLKLGQVLSIVARCFFMLLLLLLAKGWTISSERLTHRGAVIGVVLAYLSLSVLLLVWSYAADDPKRTRPTRTIEVLTICLNVVWLAFACWFSVQVFAYGWRAERNPAKRSMYLKLGVVFTPWFFLLPLCSLGVFLLDPWARDRIVSILTLCVTSGAYSVLVFLFWPSRAAEYFQIEAPNVATNDYDADYATL